LVDIADNGLLAIIDFWLETYQVKFQRILYLCEDLDDVLTC